MSCRLLKIVLLMFRTTATVPENRLTRSGTLSGTANIGNLLLHYPPLPSRRRRSGNVFFFFFLHTITPNKLRALVDQSIGRGEGQSTEAIIFGLIFTLLRL